MQFTVAAFAKLAVAVASIGAVVATPTTLMQRHEHQDTCLADTCFPGVPGGCCPGTACTGITVAGVPLPGLCTPAACDVICSETVECCADVPGTTFTCQLAPGQTVGVCVPQVV